jgi:transmembrane sensor
MLFIRPLVATEERYASQQGEQRQVALPDGSRMIVNTASEAVVAFTRAERTIRLGRGEAFFEVAKDHTRPFVVRTETAEVRAVGTKFSVRTENGETRVVVIEGRVQVVQRKDAEVSRMGDGSPTAEGLELAPGRKATVVDAHLYVAAVDAARETAWTSGNVEFDDAPLVDVLTDLNRYLRKPFVVDDSSLGAIRLTGRFRVGDIESVKYVLQGRFKVSAVEDVAAIHLSRSH